MTYRKIGGIHWFSIGRYRFAFCRTRPRRMARPTLAELRRITG